MRALLLSAVLVGCYASHEACPLPDELLPITETILGDECRQRGVDAFGTEWVTECDGVRCLLIVDGVEACRCRTLDYANTCSNGVPTCAEWRIYDYSEAGGRDDS